MSGEPMSEERLAEIEQDRDSGYFAEWSDVAELIAELIAEVRWLREVSEELGDAGLLEAAKRLRRERRTGASPDRTRDEE